MKSGLLMGAACGAAIVSGYTVPAFAQEEADQAAPAPTTPETIVITGSFIRGTPEDAALPVDVFNSEELAQSGVTSPLEFIKELPSVGSVLGETNQFDGSAQGSQGQGSINLRGLGPTRTLVLLDGKRTLQAPGQGYSDTNFIPLFALERVEILKDGAAATYGSDAIAGVSNFITRSNFTGVELDGDWTFIDGSDDNYTLSGLVGLDFADGTGNFMLGAGWQHRSELPSIARDFVFPGYEENNSGYSALAAPGQFLITYLGAEGLDSRVVQEEGCEQVGGTSLPFSIPLPPSISTPETACQFSYVPFDNLIEEEDRYQVFASLDADLSDRATFKVDALYAQTDIDSINSSPSYPVLQGPNGPGAVNAFSIATSNPFIADFLAANGLPPSGGEAGPLVGASVFLLRPFGWLGNPAGRATRGANGGRANNVGYRFAGNLTYELSDLMQVEAGATWWRSERIFGYPDIVGSRLQNALNGLGGADCDPATGTPGEGPCQYFNPFATASPGNPVYDLDNPYYVPGTENSPELVRFIQPFNGRSENEEQFVADLILSGETGFDLGSGPLAFAVGGQYRRNDFDRRPFNDISNLEENPCYREGDFSCVGTSTEGAGPFIFLGGWRPVSQQQDVYAAFAEANLPITDTLEVTGAVRYEDYGNPIGSTFNPKGSFRWEAAEFLTLRGSVGTTFRAPLPGQVEPSFVTSLQGIEVTGNNYKAVDIFGNPELDPETAFTYNAGAIVATGGLTISADFWTYEFDDQITLTPYNAIGNSLIDASIPVTDGGTPFIDCSAPLADLATFDGGECVQGTTRGVNIARLRTDWVNGPSVTVRGFDFAVNYDFDAGFGVFSVGGNATWNLEYDIDDFELRGLIVQEGYDAVGFGNYARDPRTLPEWKGNAYVNLNVASTANVRYTLNYIDSVTDDRCDADGCPNSTTRFGEESGAYVRQDITATYTLPLRALDLQLRAAVNNIFDEEPAEAALPLSFTQYIGDALGRHYQVGVRARF